METPAEPPLTCVGGCGRKLTSVKSRRRRMGPDCWRKHHSPTPRITGPESGQIVGQTELPLVPFQPTFWTA